MRFVGFELKLGKGNHFLSFEQGEYSTFEK